MIAVVLRQRHPNEWPEAVFIGTPAKAQSKAYQLAKQHPQERISVLSGQDQEAK